MFEVNFVVLFVHGVVCSAYNIGVGVSRVSLQIENILRQDLARRFHRCRETMTSVLADSERKNPHMYDVQTHVAFHGTLTRSFPSIGACIQW